MDEGYQIVNALLEVGWSLENLARPSAVFTPRVFMDEGYWCALLGKDLQEGVCGFGKSPDAACRSFDEAWYTCINTTCGNSRCPKCQKVKQVEEALA